MKKIVFLIPAALCIIIASCSKDSRFDPGTDMSSDFCKGFPSWIPVITYSPSADGDDTDELTAVISSAKPGSVIKLSAGEYHLGYMELYGFNGTIMGSGKEKTKLILKPSIDQISQNNLNKIPSWFRLISGNITISDITFKTPDGFLSVEDDYDPVYGSDLFTMFAVNNYNDEYYHPEGPPQKLLAKNCNFVGGTNKDMSKDVYWETEHNTWLGFWVGVDYVWPDENIDYTLTKGDYVFKDCFFDNFLDGVEGFSLGENATLAVTGCRINRCMDALLFSANYNSKILINDNIFTNSLESDIAIGDSDWGFLGNSPVNPLRRCSYIITGNQFNKAHLSSIFLCDAYTVLDPTQRLPMLFTIKGNQFTMSDENASAITAWNSQDPVIRNNRFTGTCETGIYINGGVTTDIFGYPLPENEVFAKNALVLGNNFSGLKASIAAVVLGDKTMNCTVIGTGKEKVVDDGVNNKVSGMKKLPGGHHFGPAIRDNYPMWRGRGHH